MLSIYSYLIGISLRVQYSYSTICYLGSCISFMYIRANIVSALLDVNFDPYAIVACRVSLRSCTNVHQNSSIRSDRRADAFQRVIENELNLTVTA